MKIFLSDQVFVKALQLATSQMVVDHQYLLPVTILWMHGINRSIFGSFSILHKVLELHLQAPITLLDLNMLFHYALELYFPNESATRKLHVKRHFNKVVLFHIMESSKKQRQAKILRTSVSLGLKHFYKKREKEVISIKTQADYCIN